MMLLELLTIAAVSTAGVQSVSPTPTSAPSASPVAKAAVVGEDDRIICRSDRVTGSRFPVRTCRTKKEWRDWRAGNRRDQEHLQNDNGRAANNNPAFRP